jgi:cytoskeleton protein RodZ
MVENFGSYLKHERELRGVPLEEISGATNIHIRFLKALEENSFDELPGEVFIKGYIRSYANIIGSDVEEMLNIYKESVEHKNEENVTPPTPSFGARSKTFLTFGLLFLVVVGLFFGVGSLMKKEDGTKEKEISLVQDQTEITTSNSLISPDISENLIVEGVTEKTEKNEVIQQVISVGSEVPELSVNPPDQINEDLDKKKVLSAQESTELNVQVPIALQADQDPQTSEGMEKPLRLTIRAQENSWFNMTIDDFREEDFILPAGTAKTFGANDVFKLTIGNKTGIELSLNGKLINLPESKDRVIKDFIINSKQVE